MPVGIEASSPFEDQSVRLASFMTSINDKVPVVAHGPGLSCGVHDVRRGSGGLLALVLRLPRRCGRWRASAASRGHQRTRSGGLSAAKHSDTELSGRLFLPHFGPSGLIGTRSSSGVVPLPLMLFSTTRWVLRLFGTEVVYYMICTIYRCVNDIEGGGYCFGVPFPLCVFWNSTIVPL